MTASHFWQMDWMGLHSALMLARQNAGLSQQQLADRLGVDRRTVLRWENGLCDPSSQDLYRWAGALGLAFTVASVVACDTSVTIAREAVTEFKAAPQLKPETRTAERSVRFRDRFHSVPRHSLDGENATDRRDVHGKSARSLSPARTGAAR